MVVSRRNTALLAQVGVGVVTAAFVFLATIAPFGKASFVAGTALTAVAVLAAVALVFECVMIPFGASAIRAPIRAVAIPFALLGVLGSASVVFGAFEFGPLGQWTTVALRIATPVAAVATIALGFWGRARGQ